MAATEVEQLKDSKNCAHNTTVLGAQHARAGFCQLLCRAMEEDYMHTGWCIWLRRSEPSAIVKESFYLVVPHMLLAANDTT